MKKTLIVLALLSSITRGESIPMAQVTNEYLTITMPETWRLEVVAGKERQMQMSLRISSDRGQTQPIFLFAQWDGLDPRKWVGTNVTTKYTLGSSDYFVRSKGGSNELEIVTQGQKYVISTSIPLEMRPEILAILMNSLGTMKVK